MLSPQWKFKNKEISLCFCPHEVIGLDLNFSFYMLKSPSYIVYQSSHSFSSSRKCVYCSFAAFCLHVLWIPVLFNGFTKDGTLRDHPASQVHHCYIEQTWSSFTEAGIMLVSFFPFDKVDCLCLLWVIEHVNLIIWQRNLNPFFLWGITLLCKTHFTPTVQQMLSSVSH